MRARIAAWVLGGWLVVAAGSPGAASAQALYTLVPRPTWAAVGGYGTFVRGGAGSTVGGPADVDIVQRDFPVPGTTLTVPVRYDQPNGPSWVAGSASVSSSSSPGATDALTTLAAQTAVNIAPNNTASADVTLTFIAPSGGPPSGSGTPVPLTGTLPLTALAAGLLLLSARRSSTRRALAARVGLGAALAFAFAAPARAQPTFTRVATSGMVVPELGTLNLISGFPSYEDGVLVFDVGYGAPNRQASLVWEKGQLRVLDTAVPPRSTPLGDWLGSQVGQAQTSRGSFMAWGSAELGIYASSQGIFVRDATTGWAPVALGYQDSTNQVPSAYRFTSVLYPDFHEGRVVYEAYDATTFGIYDGTTGLALAQVPRDGQHRLPYAVDDGYLAAIQRKVAAADGAVLALDVALFNGSATVPRLYRVTPSSRTLLVDGQRDLGCAAPNMGDCAVTDLSVDGNDVVFTTSAGVFRQSPAHGVEPLVTASTPVPGGPYGQYFSPMTSDGAVVFEGGRSNQGTLLVRSVAGGVQKLLAEGETFDGKLLTNLHGYAFQHGRAAVWLDFADGTSGVYLLDVAPQVTPPTGGQPIPAFGAFPLILLAAGLGVLAARAQGRARSRA